MRRFPFLCSLSLLFGSCAAAQQSSDARINQMQVVGSHNSYHVGLTPGTRAMLAARNPKALRGLEYEHRPLAEQLDSGVRQIELDLYADTAGGLYAHPASERVLEAMGLPPEPYDTHGAMSKPGFKVMHVQDLDQRSSCITLADCLHIVKAWSDAHPRHVPLFILLEAKVGKPLAMPGAVTPEPFTPAVFDALDTELRAIFPAGSIITPDTVRGKHTSLPEAIATGGWPTLGEARGKVVFLLDNRALTPVYAQAHPALQGRVLFTNSVPGDADAAFTEENAGTEAHIDELVRQGYLVRTRADADTEQARSNDTTVRDMDLRSGAQIISTDYFSLEPARWDGHYVVELPGKVVARCNPINAPQGCPAGELE